ncbi:MAG TPA: 4Fe-4S dicluster domain-containing protein [Caulobacteraceae bacterium]|jgi:molybdopterin-containing oxidoreductase family iron-sulfur binding subunit|nr:4Fe-4S dicluster domain-containing protein [Caulobacteraceae bacterium]
MSRYEVIRGRQGATGSGDPHRREVLGLLAAGAATALVSCGRPREAVTPFADFNGDVASGAPVRYATALELSGYARGVLGVVVDGRPIKVDGNPHHPASLGSTDPFLEAAVLDLFDPQRSKTPMRRQVPMDRNAAVQALRARLDIHKSDRGAGLALLTGRVLSPTVLRRIKALVAAYPALRRVRWEPLHDDAEQVGAQLAHGRPLEFRPRLGEADVLVSLDADPLGPGPDQIRLARAFAARRRPESGPMSRLYVIESGYTPTGVMADQHYAARPERVHDAAIALASALGAPVGAPSLPEPLARLVARMARDLRGPGARGLVLAGRSQAPEIHALTAWMNGRVRAPVDAYAPLDPVTESHAVGLAGLADAMHRGEVKTLLVVDSDPIYGAPASLGFGKAMRKVPFTFHAGVYRGATGRVAGWHAPLSHPFESWSDARAYDGTASLVQPLVAPLYDTFTAHGLFAAMLEGQADPDIESVKQTWKTALASGDPTRNWTDALAAGAVPGTLAAPIQVGAARLPVVKPAGATRGLTLVLRPSPQVWDGRYGANAWLQECPDPVTKETWGASLAISPADAARAGVASGEAVAVKLGDQLIQAVVRIDARQAEGAVSLPTGFGHTDLGPVADGVGANGLALRDAGQSFALGGIEIVRTGNAKAPPSTQATFKLDGDDAKLFPIVAAGAVVAQPATRLDLLTPQRDGDIAWAMVIDTSICIGCNACVIGCQAENNVPVIGASEIARNRDMHWLRVDRYERPDGQGGFQPVPCMQCEEAPCEPVCPVEASVHDSEGINDQVYNRCIGTRFCQANCPYKVRRFNFHDNERWPVFGMLDPRSIEAQRNPEVSVRSRGVMEKCNYCIQRVSAARRTAEKENRAIRDGEATTACQDACPTRAISFGNRADPAAAVNPARGNPRHYVLLEELKTRPRTTYLARATNRAPDGGEA